MSELLLELFSEEIPSRMQARAAEDLKRLAADALEHLRRVARHRFEDDRSRAQSSIS